MRTCDAYHASRSGNIDARELKALCYDRGYYLSEEELAVAFTELDVDGEGEIGADEFSKWCVAACRRPTPTLILILVPTCPLPDACPRWRTSDRFGSLQLTEAQQAAVSHLTTYFRYFDDDNSVRASVPSNRPCGLHARSSAVRTLPPTPRAA